MAKGLFISGFTAAEVLQIQAKAKAMLVEGKTVMSYTDSGTSVNKAFPMPVSEVLEECAYALPILDPEAYGRPKNVRQIDWRAGEGGSWL